MLFRSERTAYGTVFFRELARNQWVIERNEQSNPVQLTLRNNKDNFAAQHDPLGFELAFGPDSVRVGTCEPIPDEKTERNLVLQDQIQELMADGQSRDYTSIANLLGESAESVRVKCYALKKRGLLEKVTGGKWVAA